MNFSFSGCGFLGIYHVGVAAAIKEYAPDLVVHKISGASGGAMAACALICNLCLGQVCSDILRVSILARQRALGPLHPSFNLTSIIREGLVTFLPDNAHKMASGRLFISLTRLSDGVNFLVSEYKSKDDLIDALTCSAFIPFYSGTVPPMFQGVHYIDGGWSDNLPVLDKETITVSPFSGEADICPADAESGSFLLFDLKNTTIRFTSKNVYRIGVALFPPHPDVMSDMCRQGFEDTLRFLARHGSIRHTILSRLISCTRCIAVRSSIVLAEGGTTDANTEMETSAESSSSPFEKSIRPRIIPRSMSVSNAETLSESDCHRCVETAARAPRKGLPRIVRRSLADASAKEKNMFSFFFSSKLYTVMRYLSLPWILPFDLTVATFNKICERMPSFCDASKQVLDFLLKQLDLHSPSRTVKLMCQLAITEMNFSNLSSDVANMFDLFEATDGLPPPRAYDQTDTVTSAASTGRMTTSEMNFGFTVNMSEKCKPLKTVSTIFAEDKGELSEFTTSSVSKVLDDLEWAGYRKATSLFGTAKALRQTPSEVPFENSEFDTLGAILNYSRKHDALMAYYYTDESNRMKLTEIFGVEAEPTSVRSSSPVYRNNQTGCPLENDLVDSGISIAAECGKAHPAGSLRRKLEKIREKNHAFDSGIKLGLSSSSAISKSYPTCRKGNVARQQQQHGQKTCSSWAIPNLLRSTSESDPDMLFIPERSRANCISENVSYEGGSSDNSSE
ncbi:Phospholipase, patatin family [Trichuris trichiura]|uniref:triacylglycerol lipase n=1 Tax=Trichuris trichiura TaxID=36087 RepID=A0A077ZAY9_TRITR|nr:Phospholipase, patatin family [Trichuris trichiura]